MIGHGDRGTEHACTPRLAVRPSKSSPFSVTGTTMHPSCCPTHHQLLVVLFQLLRVLLVVIGVQLVQHLPATVRACVSAGREKYRNGRAAQGTAGG